MLRLRNLVSSLILVELLLHLLECRATKIQRMIVRKIGLIKHSLTENLVWKHTALVFQRHHMRGENDFWVA